MVWYGMVWYCEVRLLARKKEVSLCIELTFNLCCCKIRLMKKMSGCEKGISEVISVAK